MLQMLAPGSAKLGSFSPAPLQNRFSQPLSSQSSTLSKRMFPCGCSPGWLKRSAEEGEGGVPSLASQRGDMVYLLATCAPLSNISFLAMEQLPLS